MTASPILIGAALTLFALMAAAPSAVTGPAPSSRGSRSVTILHVNDTHGRYMPFTVAPGNATAQTGDSGRTYTEFDREGRVGGMAYLASAVTSVRREKGAANVILVHSGDAFSDDLLGNLTEGGAMIRLMNALGFQFMALGNHDFDYGLECTRELQRMARFPMRAANAIEKSTGKPVLGDPTMVVEAGGVRVGFLALGYHNTDQTTNPENVRDLEFSSGIEAAKRYIPDLRRRSDVVVVVSHQGTQVDRVLANEAEGIDLILGGHSHDKMDDTGRVRLVQSLSDASVLGEVTIKVENGRVTEVEHTSHTLWNDHYEPDPNIEALIEDLRSPRRHRLEEVIGTAGERIGRQYKSESPFDKLVGNILREETGSHVAMLPGIGYGISLQAGPITREALYALLPHPSKLVTLTLSGQQIVEILEQSATNQAPSDPEDGVGGLIQTSGMGWTADLSRPIGQRIGHVSVGTEPIALDESYRVATHNGMLSGIHRYTTFADARDIEKSDRKMVDIVEEHLRSKGSVTAPPVGDIVLIKASESAREEGKGPRP